MRKGAKDVEMREENEQENEHDMVDASSYKILITRTVLHDVFLIYR